MLIKSAGRLLIGLLTIIIVYTFWDNNRVTVREEAIRIKNLPNQLEGFRILQISDLHEKQFGKNQKKLIEEINAIDYDAIVFTGDMLDSRDSTTYEAFYALLEGISNKENAWFVPGNADPDSYQLDGVIEKSDFIDGMEERGVKLLESVETVSIEGSQVYFVNFELSILKDPDSPVRVNGVVQPNYVRNEHYVKYRSVLWKDLNVLDEIGDNDVVIALNHYPIPDIRIDHIKNNPNFLWRRFDLIVAGHYHGGQIRLPFIGALFIPEPWYQPNSFLPPQDRVKGLWEYKETKQYVSTGLGSSDAISFLKFRLFNPPELNILQLKREE
nr:metallophosphoesterase [Oceanobacillus saliphilus]